jgi:hypothetical protein
VTFTTVVAQPLPAAVLEEAENVDASSTSAKRDIGDRNTRLKHRNRRTLNLAPPQRLPTRPWVVLI